MVLALQDVGDVVLVEPPRRPHAALTAQASFAVHTAAAMLAHRKSNPAFRGRLVQRSRRSRGRRPCSVLHPGAAASPPPSQAPSPRSLMCAQVKPSSGSRGNPTRARAPSSAAIPPQAPGSPAAPAAVVPSTTDLPPVVMLVPSPLWVGSLSSDEDEVELVPQTSLTATRAADSGKARGTEDVHDDEKTLLGPSSGALVTAGVLTAGLVSFRYGNSRLGQKLMRARVVAQGVTVALMVGSAYYYGDQIKLFKKGSSP
ncbi:hypothetical protein ACQ4PT_067996 [Festuca glaucescens]